MKKITKQKAIIYLGGSYPQIQGVKAIKIPTVPDGENEAELCGGTIAKQ